MLPCLQGHLELIRRNPSEKRALIVFEEVFCRQRSSAAHKPGSTVLVTSVLTKRAATAVARETCGPPR